MARLPHWEYRTVQAGTPDDFAAALNKLEAEFPGEWEIVAADVTFASGHLLVALLKRALSGGEVRAEQLSGF